MVEPKAYEPEKLTAGVTWKWGSLLAVHPSPQPKESLAIIDIQTQRAIGFFETPRPGRCGCRLQNPGIPLNFDLRCPQIGDLRLVARFETHKRRVIQWRCDNVSNFRWAPFLAKKKVFRMNPNINQHSGLSRLPEFAFMFVCREMLIHFKIVGVFIVSIGCRCDFRYYPFLLTPSIQ